MIEEVKHEVKLELKGGWVHELITHENKRTQEDAIGVYLSQVSTIANLLNQVTQAYRKILNTNEGPGLVAKIKGIKEQMDKWKVMYLKGLKMVGNKEVTIEAIDPNKRMKRKDIKDAEKLQLTRLTNAISNVKKAKELADELIAELMTICDKMFEGEAESKKPEK